MNQNLPLVSIIIPFYNHNVFIQKTLDSILEDTYPNKEIIIINDGSTDPDDGNIVLWIQHNSDKVPVKYIKRGNKGLTKTLNELVQLSNGKYILPCASDDYLMNNTLKERVKILEQLESENKLVLVSDNIVVDNNNKLLFDSNLFDLRRVDAEKLYTDDGLKFAIINQWSFAGPSWIANKKLFTEYNLQFDENFIVEDWDFYLRISANNYAYFYNQKVSAYRWNPKQNNNSEAFNKRIKEDLCKTALKNSELFEEPYKQMLLDRSQIEEKNIKDIIKHINPIRWLSKRTKVIRYKFKRYLKA
jgi:glycosyltransferase involved in cell wall biosynthesis